MSILVIGLGFVGLTTAVGFASKGAKIFGFDTNLHIVDGLKKGLIEFHEPGLIDLMNENGNLINFLNDLTHIDRRIDMVFFCVGTPYTQDGSADLTQLYSAIDSLSLISENFLYDVELVIKSTVPPGTTNKVNNYLKSTTFSRFNYKLFNNPEFLREGYAVNDFLNPDRIVIGYDDNMSLGMTKVASLYSEFKSEIIMTNYNTSEFIKYLSNTLLSTLISFSNEMSMIADNIGGVSVKKAFDTLHKDFRLSNSAIKSYIYPGFGYGGYCLPKDTMALSALSKSLGYHPKILNGNIEVNEEIIDHVIAKIDGLLEKNDRVGLLGLSFKPESDDVRETKSYLLLKKLTELGHNKIVCHDPVAIEKFRKKYTDLDLVYEHNLNTIYSNSDVVILATPWKEYINFLNGKSNSNKKIIDLKYWIYDFNSL